MAHATTLPAQSQTLLPSVVICKLCLHAKAQNLLRRISTDYVLLSLAVSSLQCFLSLATPFTRLSFVAILGRLPFSASPSTCRFANSCSRLNCHARLCMLIASYKHSPIVITNVIRASFYLQVCYSFVVTKVQNTDGHRSSIRHCFLSDDATHRRIQQEQQAQDAKG